MKIGALATAAALMNISLSSCMPKGKRERIVGYYNPETDKQPERNGLCPCSSGKKFKKCCINKGK